MIHQVSPIFSQQAYTEMGSPNEHPIIIETDTISYSVPQTETTFVNHLNSSELTAATEPAAKIKFVTSIEAKRQVLNAINALAHEIHVKLSATHSESICFAPMSITPVLGMVIKAMPEEQRLSFLDSMQLGHLPEEMFHQALMEILLDLSQATGTDSSVQFANAIGLSELGKTYIDPIYQRDIEELYRGEIFCLDLSAVQKVNEWASQKTDGMIQNFLSPSDIPLDPLVAVLLNAISFSGKWSKEFDPAAAGVFTLASGTQVPAQMMKTTGMFRIYQGDQFSMVEIPYMSPEAHHLSQLIFLPNNPEDLNQIENCLTPEFIARCRDQASIDKIDLKIPKVEINFKEQNLLQILCELGLPLHGQLPLLGPCSELAAIVHQAKLIVDEKGTKGAAVTGAIVVETTSYKPRSHFNVDHDYAFVIVDGDTILFQGNVRDPSALTH